MNDMKNIFHLLFFLALSLSLNAQLSTGLNYQGIALDSNGNTIANSTIGVEIILNSSSSVEYSETHFVDTDQGGAFQLEIGSGNATSGNYDAIDWSDGNKTLAANIDPNGGTNFTSTSGKQLWSVPYAMLAYEVETAAPGPIGPAGENGLNGAVGASGVTGPIGGSGQNGAPGPTGPPGTGPTGPQGPTGPPSPNGAMGVTGPTGPAGANGPNGAQGPTGAPGSNGAAGAAGATGATGPAGTSLWESTASGMHLTSPGAGIVMEDEDNNCWLVSVDTDGSILINSINCN